MILISEYTTGSRCTLHPTKVGKINIFRRWLYVVMMSRTRFRVNPHSIVTWMSRNSLLETGAKCWIYCCIFFGNRNNKEINKQTRNKNKKHDKILMLAKSELNSIETLVSPAPIDMAINHEDLLRFWEKKITMRRWKKMWGMWVKN